MADVLFEPLRFRNLTVKNRLLRSNIAGRFDDYDGSGTSTRINWELKFARGGVGAIVSSWCGVDPGGFIAASERWTEMTAGLRARLRRPKYSLSACPMMILKTGIVAHAKQSRNSRRIRMVRYIDSVAIQGVSAVDSRLV